MEKRRLYLVRTTKLLALAGVAALAYVYFGALFAPAGVRSSAVTVVDVSHLAPGAMLQVEGLKVPVWVLHRSAAMIDALADENPALDDPHSARSRQPATMRERYRSAVAEYFVFVPLSPWNNQQNGVHGYRRVKHLPATPQDAQCSGMAAVWRGGFADEGGADLCFDYAGRVYRRAGLDSLGEVNNLPVPQHRFVGSGQLEIDASDLTLR